MPTSASAPRNAVELSPVFMPVSISVHPSPARTRETFTIVGGRGRNTCTTPSATSRVLAASLMLLVHVLLHGEADAHAHAPRSDTAVLDHRGDAVDLHLGLDALERRGRAGDREPDGVLDGVRRRPRELDRLLDHGSGPPPAPGVGLEHRAEARYTRCMAGATVGVGFGVGLAMGVLATWLVVGLRARERAGEAREVRARLEAELEGERRLASERVTMLEAGEERLREAFEALSRRALDVNNRSFLELARVQLGQFQQGARSDLGARQTAIDHLLRPVRESLPRMGASRRPCAARH